MTSERPAVPLHFKLAKPARFGSWRRTMVGVFDVAADPKEIGLFDGSVAAWATNQILLSEIKASPTRLIRSLETIVRSRLDHFAITLLLSGSAAGLAETTEVDAEWGDIFFIDLSRPVALQLSVRSGTTTAVTLWIPRTRMLSSISDEHALHGFGVKGTTPAGALIGASLRSLAEQADRMSVQEVDAIANGVIELTASAITPILANATTSGAPTPLASFVTVRRFIDRNLKSRDLSPQTIARDFGLSRASLYRLFEPVGGIAGYIRKQRLKQAFQEITAADLSNQRIGQIAYRFGFKNVSAFSRLFRDTYGVSPREARAAKVKSVSYITLKADDNDGPSLGSWLAQVS